MGTDHDIADLYARSDALALADLVRRREVSSAELVEAAIDRILRVDPTLNAVVIRTFDAARAAAARHDREGGGGFFAGVPFLLKNIGSMWSGVPLDNGMVYLDGFVPDRDSAMVTRMKAAGLIVLGRTNTPEGGWSIGTEPPRYGPTRNPWRLDRTPGGSSGGAAAAVASRMVPIAEASDGGGSIRVPAACCGLVGLKPSRGRISYGPIDADIWFGSVATFAVSRTVRDSAAFLDATAVQLPGDPYTPPRPDGRWLDGLSAPRRPRRIGVTTRAAWGEETAPVVRAAVELTAGRLADLGHRVQSHDPAVDLAEAWRHYNVVAAVETAHDFERWAKLVGRPVREDELTPFNWSMLMYGRGCSAIDYAAAIHGVRQAGQRIATELSSFDVFLTPVLTQPVRPVGYWSMATSDRDAYLRRWSDAAYMFAFNISGLPAVSIPADRDPDGVPIGVQLVGRLGREEDILALAADLEGVVGWPRWVPPALS
jgi:amidase